MQLNAGHGRTRKSPRGEEWWADVLADPRARKRERRTDLAVKQAFYRLADEKREIAEAQLISRAITNGSEPISTPASREIVNQAIFMCCCDKRATW